MAQDNATPDRKAALVVIAVTVALLPAVGVALENGGSWEHFLLKLINPDTFMLFLFTGGILQALCIIYDIISFAIVQIGRLCGWMAASVRFLGRWMANCAASKNPEGPLRARLLARCRPRAAAPGLLSLGRRQGRDGAGGVAAQQHRPHAAEPARRQLRGRQGCDGAGGGAAQQHRQLQGPARG